MTEKRISQRYGPLAIKALFVVNGEKRDGYLTNVSVGGAFLAVSDPPPLGVELDLAAQLPWRLGELRVRARVVWRHAGDGAPSVTGVGLAFTEVDEEGRALLDRYLARFAELAAMLDEPDGDEPLDGRDAGDDLDAAEGVHEG